ncbi:MAG: 30S ribosomal protein S9 [Armatimonadota bacterium]|nr:30S ribosomal protein S9 [Armatimonadota bacterium]MDR7439231.1 30S ribosomal protein S9 [Armatimonadota bacterium]MDR7563306.1 30S ribosomal protein S9 [Armatimonadota bacterium]MDR7567380.1 30S ribosomal protein S9 [Armatimonadota bacterium]MDR7602379.1 30S ribosomal protein S9 [Armatimonadota bacterium]
MSTVVAPQVQATGRRKEASARVFLRPGSGRILVNGTPYDEYFVGMAQRARVIEPLLLTNTLDRFDVYATVSGGGQTGQSDAVRHGIARALAELDPSLRPLLRQHGLLTRDPRVKERKKYGRKRARRGFQYSKR